MKSIYFFFLWPILTCSLLMSSANALETPKDFKEGLQGSIQTTTSINQHGITWTFAKPVQSGQFVNGDYWVIGPVNIIGISPASIDNGTGRIINGSEINPDPNGVTQGYDSAVPSVQAPYNAALNVALGVSSGSPLTIASGNSLVSTVSLTAPTSFVWLKSASVLTVLAEAPLSGSFRPPYVGTNKAIRHNEADINYSYLKSLTPTDSAPTLLQASAYFSKVWLDYRGGYANRPIHPLDNMPDYGRDMSSRSGEVALLLNCNFTNSEKRDALVNYLQYGLDLWGVIDAGFPGWWQDGGQGGGRKFPILFAGKILGNTGMLTVGSLPYNNPVFGEDQTTIYMTEYEAKRWLGTDGKYPSNNIARDFQDAYYTEADWTYINRNGQTGIPEYSKWNGSGYQGRWISRRLDASYRPDCHVNGFTGWILAVHVMGLKRQWNHDALFDYADRYLAWAAAEGLPYWNRHYSGFAGQMWEKYRGVY